VQFGAFLLLLLFYRISLLRGLLAFPVVALETGMFALALGALFSMLNVKYRDVRYALPFVIQVWMIATPVMYPTTVVPERYRWLWMLNPLAGIMDAFRSMLSGQPIEWPLLASSSIISIVLLIAVLRAFARMEETVADLI
jgi:lipopolysaccharide transport system permease protein